MGPSAVVGLIAEAAVPRRWHRRAWPVSLRGGFGLGQPAAILQRAIETNMNTPTFRKTRRSPPGNRLASHGRHRGLIPRFKRSLKGALRWVMVRRGVLLVVMQITIKLIQLFKSRD